MRVPRPIRLAFLLLLLAGACARGTLRRDVVVRTATPPAAGPGVTPGGAEPARCAASTGGQEGAAALLVDVRVGSHATFDRITFEFEPAEGRPDVVPRYQIAEVAPPLVYDGSGEPMRVAGRVFVQVIFHGASGVDLSAATVRETYTGRKEFSPNFGVLVEAERQGDFEATLSWVLGLSRRSCWTASELSGPARVAIDLPH